MVWTIFWLALCLSAGGCFASEGYRDAEGLLHVDDVWALRPAGAVVRLRNAGHPERAPPNLRQNWTVIANPDGAIRLQCLELYVPKRTDGICTDYVFTIIDGEYTQNLCGSLSGLSYLSNSRQISVILKTGFQQAAHVDCRAQAREMGPDGEVTDPPPPTTPTPPPSPVWPPPFNNLPSQEIDSSEHGGPPGPVPTTCPCGQANKNTEKIIGGEEAKVNEFPFAAFLVYAGSLGQFCGCSVITTRHVITAAHCVTSKLAEQIQVIMGGHNYVNETSPYTIRADVKEVVMHEKYSEHKQYDVALLLLAEPIRYNRYVSPVCLPARKLDLGHSYLTAMGWGRVGWTKTDYPSVFLKKMKVRAVPLEECAGYAGVATLDPHQLCTYGSRRGLGQGDSGGSVVWLDPETNRYTLVGLPSFVYPFVGQNYRPDVTADVSSLLPWIHHHIARTDPSSRACWSTGGR